MGDKIVGAIDSLIVDINNLVKQIFSGDYVGFCSMTVMIVQKLARLKDEVKKIKETAEEG